MRPDAPPRAAVIRGAAAPKEKVQEPPLAADAPIDMPKGTQKDIARVAGDKATADRLLQHLTVVLTALDDRDGRTALPHARYLKARLPRTGLLRELLGTALYLEEDYPGALSELAAYRRITGNQDRNHLVADALRAVGENEDRIPELVEAMEDEDQDVDEAARFEGRIVWASWLADNGDVGAARAVLAPLLDQTVETPEEHHLRLWYVAGDLAERGDDDEAARSWFGRISAEADGFFDTDERLDRLTP